MTGIDLRLFFLNYTKKFSKPYGSAHSAKSTLSIFENITPQSLIVIIQTNVGKFKYSTIAMNYINKDVNERANTQISTLFLQ